MSEKIDKSEIIITSTLENMNKVIFISMLILNLDNLLLFVFSLTLNNWLIIFSIIFASIVIILNWRISRNIELFMKNEPNDNILTIDKLLLFSIVLLILQFISLIYTFLIKIYSGAGKEDFKQLYFEEDINLIYSLNLFGFALYSVINLLYPVTLITNLLKLKRIINNKMIVYTRYSSTGNKTMSSSNLEIIDISLIDSNSINETTKNE